jgi:hypothetical protein
LSLSRPWIQGGKSAILVPAEMMHDLGYQLAGRLNKSGFQIFIRLVGLVD